MVWLYFNYHAFEILGVSSSLLGTWELSTKGWDQGRELKFSNCKISGFEDNSWLPPCLPLKKLIAVQLKFRAVNKKNSPLHSQVLEVIWYLQYSCKGCKLRSYTGPMHSCRTSPTQQTDLSTSPPTKQAPVTLSIFPSTAMESLCSTICFLSALSDLQYFMDRTRADT